MARRIITAVVLLLALIGVVLGGKWAVGHLGEKPAATQEESLTGNNCAALPARADVEASVAAHPDLIAAIQAVTPNARVLVNIPCEGQPKAIVLVLVETAEEKQAVEAILVTMNFGLTTEVRVIS